MNILFIGKRHYTHRDALQERYGRIYQLPFHWAGKGCRTQLWLIDYHGRKRKKKQDGSLSVDSTPIRGIGWMAKVISLIFARNRSLSPTHVVASGDAYIGLLGFFIARVKGAKFIFDVYDKYDEFGGYRRPFGLDLFGFLLRHADQCWFASRRLRNQLGNESRDAMVMNGIDSNRFKPMEMAQARIRLGLPVEGRLAGYFGGMEPDRGISDLIEAVANLRLEGLDISLVLAGRKHSETAVPSLPWLHDLGNISFDDMPCAYAAVDVFCIPYRRSGFLDAASSNKIAEVLASGRLVAATRTPNLTENFNEVANALSDRLAEPGVPVDLARCIRLQLEDPVLACLPSGFELSEIADHALSRLVSTGEGSDAKRRENCA